MHAAITEGLNSVSYVGSTWVTGGTNVFRGLTSIQGWPLALRMTTDANGAVGHIRLAGRVTSAAVDGKLTVAPLNPLTGA